jgi:hypothetical protein
MRLELVNGGYWDGWPPSQDNRHCFQRIRFDTERNFMLEQHGFYILRIRGEAADGDALHGSARITAPCLSFSLSFHEAFSTINRPGEIYRFP